MKSEVVFVKKRVWNKRSVDFRMFKEPLFLWVLVFNPIWISGQWYVKVYWDLVLLMFWFIFYNIPTYKVEYVKK